VSTYLENVGRGLERSEELDRGTRGKKRKGARKN